MQHLRPRGLHARALPGRENDDVNVGHVVPIIVRCSGQNADAGARGRSAAARGPARLERVVERLVVVQRIEIRVASGKALFSGFRAIARSRCAIDSACSPRWACATASM